MALDLKTQRVVSLKLMGGSLNLSVWPSARQARGAAVIAAPRQAAPALLRSLAGVTGRLAERLGRRGQQAAEGESDDVLQLVVSQPQYKSPVLTESSWLCKWSLGEPQDAVTLCTEDEALDCVKGCRAQRIDTAQTRGRWEDLLHRLRGRLSARAACLTG